MFARTKPFIVLVVLLGTWYWVPRGSEQAGQSHCHMTHSPAQEALVCCSRTASACAPYCDCEILSEQNFHLPAQALAN